MTPLPQYGYTDEEIDHIQNWSDAIFASPRIYYASNYSELIKTKDGGWTCLIDVKIKPYGFTKHEYTVLLLFPVHRELPFIDDIIYRISSEDDIIVVAIAFLYNSSPNEEFMDVHYISKYLNSENLKIDFEDKLIL